MANQITYEQAMAQLTTMFPHVEKDVVAFLLESNKYHVERTVETLLSMTSTKPSTPVANTSSSHHEHKQGRSQPTKTIQTRSGTLNLAIQDDFLRPPNYFSRRSGNASSPLQQGQDGSHLSQIDQDALLAAMLQDELFMQDLAQHPERYMVAEQHAQPVARPVHRSPVPTSHTGPLQNVSATSAAIATQGNKPDISGFGSNPAPDNISKWSSLTSAAKAKLASLAAKFKSDQHSKQLQESELGKVAAPNQPYHALSSNLDESLLGPSHDNAPRDDDFSLDDDELPTSPHAAGAEVEMKERGRTTRTSR